MILLSVNSLAKSRPLDPRQLGLLRRKVPFPLANPNLAIPARTFFEVPVVHLLRVAGMSIEL